MGSKMLKRFVLSTLAVCMAFTGIHVTNVNAIAEESVTDVELVMNNFDFSADEKAIFEAGYIKSSKTYTYVTPDDQIAQDENLITVDADNQAVTVVPYTDSYGNVWQPTAVIVTEAGYPDIEVSMTSGTGSFKAQREGRPGNNYTVFVTYTYTEDLDLNNANDVANAAHHLNKAVKSMTTISKTKSELENLATIYIDYLKMLSDGVPLPNGSVVGINGDPDTVAAVDSLYNEIVGNVSKRLTLQDYILKYTEESSKPVYLFENGQEFYDVAVYAQQRINQIANSTAIQNLISNKDLFNGIPGYEDFVSALENLATLMTLIKSLSDSLANGLTADGWTILTAPNMLTDAGKTSTFSKILTDGIQTSEHDITNPTVTVKEVKLTASVNRYKVTASVEAEGIKIGDTDNEIVSFGSVSTELFLDGGATLNDIINAAEDSDLVESAQFKAWAETYGVNIDNYDITYYVNGNPVTEHELTSAINFTVKFSPKTEYTISSTSAPELAKTDVPYGYNFVLPKHSDASKSYDYTVNGKNYLETEVYRVIGNTVVERQEGRAQTPIDLLTAISNDKSYNFGGAIANTILTSDAVKDEKIQYPLIGQEDAEDLIAFDGTVVTAKSYKTSIAGMEWTAVSYTANGNTVPFTDYDSNNTATATLGTEADDISVNYELKITQANATDTPASFDNRLLAAINVPSNIYELSKSHVSLLDTLKGKESYLNMGSQISSGLIVFKDKIQKSSRTDAEKAALINSATVLENECFEPSGALTIASYVTDYKNSGLVSFYETGVYEVYKEQLELLAEHLPAISQTDEFRALLKDVGGLSDDQIAGLDSTVDIICSLAEQLKGPSNLILADHESAPALLNAIVEAVRANQTVASFANTNLGLTARETLTKASAGKSVISVNVTFGTKTESAQVMTKENGYALTAADIQAIEDKLAEVAANLNSDSKHYTFNVTSTLPSVGQELNANIIVTGKWTTNQYTVKVPGASDATITFEVPTFTLPAAPAGTRYDYNVGGKIVSVTDKAVAYTLSAAEFDTVFASSTTFTVTKEEVNISEENLIKFVNSLNAAFAGTGSQFVLADDKSSVELVIGTGTPSMGDFANAILDGYPYIALGETTNAFYANQLISIQALINAFLDEDGKFGLDGLLNNTLLETTMYLGTSADAIEQELPMTITTTLVDGVKDYLSSASAYMDINTKGDRLNLVVEETDRPYQVLLAVMLVTGYAEIGDVNNPDFQGAVDYITSQAKEIILDENTTSTTLQNTIDKLGLDYSIAAYADTIDTVLVNFRKVYNNCEFETSARYNANNQFVGYNTVISADISPLLPKLGVDESLTAMLRETTLTFNAGYEIGRSNDAYEAVIFDNSKEGLDKVWFTKDLAGENLGTNAVVVITGEVGVVEFDNAVIVDLNGQKVDEIKYTGEGTVKVFDSALTDGEIGAIRGNVTIAGGQLKQNAGKIAESYELVDGKVESIFYSISENEDGQVVLKLKPSFINSTEAINAEALKYLAVDLALHGGMNLYTAASMTIDGNTIYQIDKYEDLIAEIAGLTSGTAIANEVLGFINCEGVTAFANDLIAKLTDFEAISGTQLGTYEITTTAWNLDPSRADENYLTAGLINGNEFTKTLVVELADDSMSEVFAELAKVVKVTTGEEGTYVKLSSLSYDGSLHATYEGGVKVEVDFNNNLEYTKLMGIILANYNADLKAPLIKWLEEGATTDFIAEINSMTTADIISAIHKASGKTYTQLLNGAGVSSVDASELEGVEYVYGVFAKYIKAASKALSKLEITGGNRKISSFDSDKDCVYVADKENWHNFNIYFSFAPYADNYKEMETIVEVTEGNIVAGYNIIDNSDVDGTITVELDTIHTGITKDMIGPGKVIDIKAKFGTIIDMDFTGSTYTYEENGTTVDSNRLFNGAKFTVVAQDHAGNTETITILVKILGDVNANGLVDSNDDLAMAKHYFGQATITDQLALWAADVNGNGSIESNDGLMCAYKYLLGINNAKYKSHLKD